MGTFVEKLVSAALGEFWYGVVLAIAFIDGTTQLYKRLGPSVGPSVLVSILL